MKSMKSLSILAARSIAVGLLLSASIAQAEEQVCVDGDTATGIKDLLLNTTEFGNVNVDVDFRYDTGWSVYGSDLGKFPFNGGNAEEDALLAMKAINDALNAFGEGPNEVPAFAGQPNQNTYWIGVEEETEFGEAAIAAVGGANYGSTAWGPCEESGATNCILGVGIVGADKSATYAALSKAQGGACGNKPPPEPPTGSFDIIPCITGSWYLMARDGEGYNVEVIGPELEPKLLAYFYTYDDAGNQMWLVGSGPVDGDTAVVPVQVTSGPVYGANYDPNDVVRENWGTLTFTFTSKDTGTVLRESTMGYGSTTYDIERVSSVTGLACP